MSSVPFPALKTFTSFTLSLTSALGFDGLVASSLKNKYMGPCIRKMQTVSENSSFLIGMETNVKNTDFVVSAPCVAPSILKAMRSFRSFCNSLLGMWASINAH